jgi:hypothetical protein
MAPPFGSANAKIPIDWKKVDSLLQSGCNGSEVADYLGIHHDTLYNRCQQEKHMLFSQYAAKLRSKGDALLREAQHKNAVEHNNTSMQIWLGKQRLEQKENPTKDQTPNDAQMTLTIDLMKKIYELEQKLKQYEQKPNAVD